MSSFYKDAEVFDFFCVLKTDITDFILIICISELKFEAFVRSHANSIGVTPVRNSFQNGFYFLLRLCYS